MNDFILKLAQRPVNVNERVGGFLDDLPQGRFTDLNSIIVAVIQWLLAFGAVLAVAAIVYSGVMFITAGGDAAKAEQAKKNLVWAITGTVLIILALMIVTWVSQIVIG